MDRGEIGAISIDPAGFEIRGIDKRESRITADCQSFVNRVRVAHLLNRGSPGTEGADGARLASENETRWSSATTIGDYETARTVKNRSRVLAAGNCYRQRIFRE